MLSLSGNKIQYLPALPLRKLLVLNLISAELHGLSQLVVQTSPHLKDLRLDNNPVKCADLLGIAEWATPCRDVGGQKDMVTSSSSTTDYHDLDDDELRELADEMERNNLKYLLDYVASKAGRPTANGQYPRQSAATFDGSRTEFCRQSATTLPTGQVHLNAAEKSAGGQRPSTMAATLVGNKSLEGAEHRETDTGETEQIARNLPNPPTRQTGTPTKMTTTPFLPTIIKTLLLPSTVSPPPPPSSTNTVRPGGESPGEKIQPHRQNNGSSEQITDHLNTNKRNATTTTDDASTNVNAEGVDKPSIHSLSVLQAAGHNDTAEVAGLALSGTEVKTRKSPESVAIKLANNKKANNAIVHGSNVANSSLTPPTAALGVDTAADGDVAGGDNKASETPVDRVHNKKLIKLTDSSNNRKLMPFIGQAGPGRRVSSSSRITIDGTGVFAQQSISARRTSSSVMAPTPMGPTEMSITTEKTAEDAKTTGKPMTSSSGGHVTSLSDDSSASPSPPSTATAATTSSSSSTFHQLPLITLSPTVAGESLPISSKQIIFQRRRPQITPTPDEVHNLVSPATTTTTAAGVVEVKTATGGQENSFATSAPQPPTTVKVVASVGSIVNETGKMRKDLPKTDTASVAPAVPQTTATAKPQPPPQLPPPPTSSAGLVMPLRKDDDAEANSTSANVELMNAAAALGRTKGLIEDTSPEDDTDNPLLELWQQASPHLAAHATITPISSTTTATIMQWLGQQPPGADPATSRWSLVSLSNAGGSGSDNERKNLISDNNNINTHNKNSNNNNNKSEKVTITRSASTSLKSETILINDRNNDVPQASADNFAGRDSKTPRQQQSDQEGFVLKLKSHEVPKENTKIYVAENSLSIAQLVPPVATSTEHRPPAPSAAMPGDSNRGRFDKLSQLSTNSIHGPQPEEEEQVGALSGAAVTPRHEGRRGRLHHNAMSGDGVEDSSVEHDGEAAAAADSGDSDNYHHRQPHPGLFIVIGASIGIVLSIGLFRCKQTWWTQRHYPLPDTGDINQTYPATHRGAAIRRPFDHYQRRQSGIIDGPSVGSGTAGDEFSRQRTAGSEDDYYRCTNWRERTTMTAEDAVHCDAGGFVDVQLTPRTERKSVKFDLLPMKILSPGHLDEPPFQSLPMMPMMMMTSDPAYQRNNSDTSSSGGCDMGPVAADRGNKSLAAASPLELW